MDKLTLAKKIYQTSKITGEQYPALNGRGLRSLREQYPALNGRGLRSLRQFTLRSGQQVNEYFDKYLFEAQPKLLFEISSQLISFIPENIDAIAGLEMGGIPLATALSLQTDIPLLFVRKEAKTYGTCKLAEGGTVEGKKLLIMEDVVTSGGAIIDAVNQLRKLGATVERALCVIDREGSGKKNLKSIGIKLDALFTKSYLESA